MKTILITCLALCATSVWADAPTIEHVEARQSGGAWTFSVTLRHADTGWDDYADGWRVLDLDGNELALRVLHHPHVNEQPFTRSQPSVRVPEGATQVQIQARDSVGGWADETFLFDLP